MTKAIDYINLEKILKRHFKGNKELSFKFKGKNTCHIKAKGENWELYLNKKKNKIKIMIFSLTKYGMFPLENTLALDINEIINTKVLFDLLAHKGRILSKAVDKSLVLEKIEGIDIKDTKGTDFFASIGNLFTGHNSNSFTNHPLIRNKRRRRSK